MSVYDSLTETQQFACRVIADHARATAFAIADGILPGNEGRNYVLRKIMRRAIYHGREHLGLTELFFYKVCDFVIDQMHEAYPELEAQREFIGKMVRLEEERFAHTLTLGLKKFKEEFDNWFNVLEQSTERYKNALADGKDQLQAIEAKIEFMDKMREKYGSGDLQHPARLLQLMYKYRIPPYVFKMFLLDRSEDLSTRGDTLWWYYTTARNHPKQFEDSFGQDWIDFIQALGTKEEKDKIKALISPGKVIDWLDIYLSGDEDFKLPNFLDFARSYDTYGTPKDLIRLALEEKGVELDDEEFEAKFELALQEIQKQTGIGQTERKSQISPIYAEVLAKVGSNNFLGYDTTLVEDAKVVAIFDGDRQIDELKEGEQGSIVLNETPFYAEAGGQVGDTGLLVRTAYGSGRLNAEDREGEVKPPANAGGTDMSAASRIRVIDTFSPISGLVLHKAKVESGSIKVGDKVTAMVDAEKRDATRRNHTATHLVHAALKEVLGSHVKQAGSVVAPNYLRFDFTHYQPVTEAEVTEIEDLVNRYILENHPVNTNIMAIEEAMRTGAVALFGEKYGSDVRVLSVGDGVFSKELCGGTHVKATGDIGSFKITSDEAIASGVRRIRAITGFDAFERFREDERLIERSLGALKTQRDQLPSTIEKLQEELKRMRKEVDELKLKIATGGGGPASSNGDETREINGIKVLGKIVDGLDANGTRQLSDTLLARLKSGVVILGRKDEGKVSIIVRVSNDLTAQIKAGDVIREITPIVGGRGGGKPDMAEGGGTEPDKLSEAIDASYKVIETLLTDKSVK